MTGKLKIRNWDRWQSYRKDRGQPPWIKLHRAVMRNLEWVSLTDAQRGQLVGLWLLAADHDGEIPADPVLLRKLCHLESDPDIQLFVSHGFIEYGVTLTPGRRQSDSPEAEAEAEAEEKKKGASAPSSSDLWRDVKAMGVPGTLLGKLAKEHGTEALEIAVAKTLKAQPAEPRSYLCGLLNVPKLDLAGYL